MSSEREEETFRVPASVRFPVELEPPPGFQVDDPATWPRVEGRLEWVDGRLLYMPPCGLRQQGTAVSVVGLLDRWLDDHPEFFLGGNEAGMLLGGDARGSEAAVWLRADVDPASPKFARTPPILVAEVAGREEGEPELRVKARWYFDRGVHVVWVVLPATREVIVLRRDGESRHESGDRLPEHPALPGLAPEVDRFFRQLR